ncbi:hypothetical protein SDC9_73712 [bioreactor metagenome]|uniref:Uncharacterized protein n=1 Tax=bioreactor metagenome TaxID=1076179 RepID=A0A644YF19_9ZZZZ
MTIVELKNLLQEKKIPQDLYSLNGGLSNEAYCIGKNKGIWEVYYSERGHKSECKKFDSESEACCYFYKALIEVLKQMKLL